MNQNVCSAIALRTPPHSTLVLVKCASIVSQSSALNEWDCQSTVATRMTVLQSFLGCNS